MPSPPDPTLPRYACAPLPPYRYVPGASPHPRRDPRGHAYGRPEPRKAVIDPAAWPSCATYLQGVDLYNLAFWWESHEAFEALWHGAGGAEGGATAAFFQGLIQIAAAELKRHMAHDRAAATLYAKGLARLAGVPSPYLGLDVHRFAADATARSAGTRDAPAWIVLALPGARP